MKKIMTITAIMAIASASQAALLVYEGFDYTSGQDLSHTTLGGSGWATASYGGYEPGYSATWSSDPTTVAVTSGSLTGPSGSYASTGNSVMLGGTVADATRVVSGGVNVVDMSQSGATMYVSYLFNASDMNGTGSEYAGLRFNSNGGGYLQVAETGSSSVALRIWTGSGGAAYTWGNYLQNDTTYLIVAKYWNDNGTVKASTSFFEDGDTMTEPVTWMATATSAAGFTPSLYQVEMVATPSNTMGAQFDELRIGTTFGDVVPEPASIGLFGIASLGMLLVRRYVERI